MASAVSLGKSSVRRWDLDGTRRHGINANVASDEFAAMVRKGAQRRFVRSKPMLCVTFDPATLV